MRARFRIVPLGVALLGATVLSVWAFSAFRQAILTARGIQPYGLPYPHEVQNSAAKAAAGATSVGGVRLSAPAAEAVRSALALMPAPPRNPRGQSQLIRTANISIEVRDVTAALRSATALTEEQLGDVIGLNDESPPSQNVPHYASMQIRVPQYRFEQTLDALAQLGKVKAKSVNAQDVADQIVDATARLRNLRRTEADILNIMDRSGNIEQVLNVTQELGSVREQIERLDAQIQSMRYQVAYSTINISLSSPAVVTAPTGVALLGDAWKSAIESLRNLTIALLSVALWLVAFSPYVLLLALLGALVLHRVRAHSNGHAATGM